MRRLRSIIGTAALCAAVTLVPAAHAAAAQHQNANAYSFWNTAGSNYWNVDQNMWVEQKATATYWAMNWQWQGYATGGAYMGLQTNGAAGGDTAIFSIWDSTAATPASGTTCRPFDGEGVGRQCFVAYPITVNRTYKFRLWRIRSDANGVWWGAWIIDTATGAERKLGEIRAPAGRTFAGRPMNFVEYFGTQVACNAVPRSIVNWTQPAFNQQSPGVYQYGSTYSSGSFGACVRGTATPRTYPGTAGVRVIHGGP